LQFSQRDFCPCDDKDRSQYIRIRKGFGEVGAEIAKRKPYGFDPPLPSPILEYSGMNGNVVEVKKKDIF